MNQIQMTSLNESLYPKELIEISFAMFFLLLLLVLPLIAFRFVYVIRDIRSNVSFRTTRPRTLCVLGSGGHTFDCLFYHIPCLNADDRAEMLQLISQLDRHRYSPFLFVCHESDANSISRATQSEV